MRFCKGDVTAIFVNLGGLGCAVICHFYGSYVEPRQFKQVEKRALQRMKREQGKREAVTCPGIQLGMNVIRSGVLSGVCLLDPVVWAANRTNWQEYRVRLGYERFRSRLSV